MDRRDDIRDLKELVGRLTYKPGSRFEIREPFEEAKRFPRLAEILKLKTEAAPSKKVQLIISVPCVDSHNPKATTPVTAIREFDREELTSMTPEGLLRYIETVLITMETHEVAEWFKVDGENVRDPHPEQKKWQDDYRAKLRDINSQRARENVQRRYDEGREAIRQRDGWDDLDDEIADLYPEFGEVSR